MNQMITDDTYLLFYSVLRARLYSNNLQGQHPWMTLHSTRHCSSLYHVSHLLSCL